MKATAVAMLAILMLTVLTVWILGRPSWEEASRYALSQLSADSDLLIVWQPKLLANVPAALLTRLPAPVRSALQTGRGNLRAVSYHTSDGRLEQVVHSSADPGETFTGLGNGWWGSGLGSGPKSQLRPAMAGFFLWSNAVPEVRSLELGLEGRPDGFVGQARGTPLAVPAPDESLPIALLEQLPVSLNEASLLKPAAGDIPASLAPLLKASQGKVALGRLEGGAVFVGVQGSGLPDALSEVYPPQLRPLSASFGRKGKFAVERNPDCLWLLSGAGSDRLSALLHGPERRLHCPFPVGNASLIATRKMENGRLWHRVRHQDGQLVWDVRFRAGQL